MKKTFLLLGIMLVTALLGAAVTKALGGGSTGGHEETITIVTSFYPVYIAAENLVDGAEGIELINLTENHSGCLHDYQLTTKDMRKLEDGDIFIMNGGGMEPFIEDIIKAYPDIRIIDAGEGIEALEAVGEHNHGSGEQEHEEEINGHFWLNPRYHMEQAAHMAEALGSLDPDHKSVYERNQKLYEEKLKSLDKHMDEIDVSAMEQGIFIFHEGFAYLADRLSLSVVHGVNLDQDASLSPGELAHMIEEGKEGQIKYIFTEEAFAKSGPSAVAEALGADLVYLDPLTGGDKDKDAYIRGMEHNIQAIKNVLS